MSSAVFVTMVSVPTGKFWMDIDLICADTNIADNYATLIKEGDIVGGTVGGIPPFWEKRIYEQEKVSTKYKVIQNFGSTDAIVPVVSVIRALKEGNTSCELRVGDSDKYRTVTLNFSAVNPISEVKFTFPRHEKI